MNYKTKVVSIILFFLAFMKLVSCEKQKAEWKGILEEDDEGYQIVKRYKVIWRY